MTATPTLQGFTRHGDRYRGAVSLTEADALRVLAEAADRDLPPGVVLRECVRAGLALDAAERHDAIVRLPLTSTD